MIQGHSCNFTRFCKAVCVILAASVLAGGFLLLPNNANKVYADEPEMTTVTPKTLPPFDPNVGGEGIKGFIGRLYLLGLGRSIVVTDSNYYLTEITSGRKTGGQVAKIILTSNEFKSFNYSDEDFVEVLYRVFFNRQAAGGGRDYWLGVLSRGTDRSRVIDSFINSVEWVNICDGYGIASGATITPTPTPRATATPRPTATNTPRPTATPTPHQLPPFDPNIGGEGVKGFIGRLYALGLGRNIVVTDSNYYLTEITSGRKTGGQVAKIILTSNEFKSFNYSDEDFVEVLYRVFFNRQAVGGGRDYWLGVLSRGTDRSRVIDSFINSVEWVNICDGYGIASGATITPTPKPTNTSTPRPTNTPRPTATNTPSPTPTPNYIQLTSCVTYEITYEEAVNNAELYFSFTPDESGMYVFYSLGENDPVATYHNMFTLDNENYVSDDDYGFNFSQGSYYEAGKTYTFTITHKSVMDGQSTYVRMLYVPYFEDDCPYRLSTDWDQYLPGTTTSRVYSFVAQTSGFYTFYSTGGNNASIRPLNLCGEDGELMPMVEADEYGDYAMTVFIPRYIEFRFEVTQERNGSESTLYVIDSSLIPPQDTYYVDLSLDEPLVLDLETINSYEHVVASFRVPRGGFYTIYSVGPNDPIIYANEIEYDGALDYADDNFYDGNFVMTEYLASYATYTFEIDHFGVSSGTTTIYIVYGETMPSTPSPTPVPTATDSQIVVASYSDEMRGLGQEYASDVDAIYVTVPYDRYQSWLNSVLASGEGAPDVYAADPEFAPGFFNSSTAMSVRELGITDAELNNMYPCTLNFATGYDGNVYGLTWCPAPSVVIYNTVVAQQTLGVSEPADVAPYFATWDAFLGTARTVSAASNGNVRVVAGWTDIYSSYVAGRETPWQVERVIDTNNSVFDFFDLVDVLVDENLTFGADQYSDAWNTHMIDHSVLSYWGPIWFGRYSMGLMGEYGWNETAGEWRAVEAPTTTLWGGTWLIASPNCKVELTAQFMRDIAISDDTVNAMIAAGDFTNSMSANQAAAANPAYGFDWLGGQNAYGIFDSAARHVSPAFNGQDASYDSAFKLSIAQYLEGASREDAMQSFANRVDCRIVEDTSYINDLTVNTPYLIWASDAADGSIVHLGFTPSESGLYRIYSEGVNNPLVRSFDFYGEDDCLLFDDNSGDDANFSMILYLEAGEYYHFAVEHSWISDTASTSVIIRPYDPAVDSITYIPLTTNVEHYIQPEDLDYTSYYFSYTPDVTGNYTIVSWGDSDPKVYLGENSDDDSGYNYNFNLPVYLEAGTTYYIRVELLNIGEGPVSVVVYDQNEPTPTPEVGNTIYASANTPVSITYSNVIEDEYRCCYVFYTVPENCVSATSLVVNTNYDFSYSLYDMTDNEFVINGLCSDASISIILVPGHQYMVGYYSGFGSDTNGTATVSFNY